MATYTYVLIATTAILLCLAHASPTQKGSRRRAEDSVPTTSVDLFKAQMENPSEVFAVLLIMGGDIIQKSVAQLSGRHVTYTAFSFGWVAYSFSALMNAVGDGTFMPAPDYPASVTNVGSGIKKASYSWVLGRLLRDLESTVENGMGSWREVITKKGKTISKQSGEWDSGLIVSIYNAENGGKKPHRDILYWSFFITFPVQLAVAAIPVKDKEWSILLMTAAGTVLAVVTGSIRVWRKEKYACRIGDDTEPNNNSYVVTRGNGHRYVFVILGIHEHRGLFLDDLAGAVSHADQRTRVASMILTALWLGFLVVCGALKKNTWYLLGVGAIGMVQNVFVAAARRPPRSHGIPLSNVLDTFGKRVQGFSRPRVMQVLYDVEKKYKGVGAAIRPEFFSDNSLRPDERKAWGLEDLGCKCAPSARGASAPTTTLPAAPPSGAPPSAASLPATAQSMVPAPTTTAHLSVSAPVSAGHTQAGAQMTP